MAGGVFGTDGRLEEGGVVSVQALPDRHRLLDGVAPVGVEHDPDLGPDRRTKSKQGLRVVDDESRMHLERDLLNAVAPRELGGLGPVRDHDLVPLPVEDLQEVVGPRARHPVRVPGALVVAGASRERHHHRDLERPTRVKYSVAWCEMDPDRIVAAARDAVVDGRNDFAGGRDRIGIEALQDRQLERAVLR